LGRLTLSEPLVPRLLALEVFFAAYGDTGLFDNTLKIQEECLFDMIDFGLENDSKKREERSYVVYHSLFISGEVVLNEFA